MVTLQGEDNLEGISVKILTNLTTGMAIIMTTVDSIQDSVAQEEVSEILIDTGLIIAEAEGIEITCFKSLGCFN